jgi:hypothetical protein
MTRFGGERPLKESSTTCGNHIMMDYRNRAGTHEATQRFVIRIVSFLILSAIE